MAEITVLAEMGARTVYSEEIQRDGVPGVLEVMVFPGGKYCCVFWQTFGEQDYGELLTGFTSREQAVLQYQQEREVAKAIYLPVGL